MKTDPSRTSEPHDMARARPSRLLLAVAIGNLGLTLLLAIIVAMDAAATAAAQARLARQLERLTMMADQQAALAKTNQETAVAARLADAKAILDAIAASRPAPAPALPPSAAPLPAVPLPAPPLPGATAASTLPPIPQIAIPNRPAPHSPR